MLDILPCVWGCGLCTIDIGPAENCEIIALWFTLLGEVMIDDGLKVARPLCNYCYYITCLLLLIY